MKTIKKLVVKITESTFILENVEMKTIKIKFRGKRAKAVELISDKDAKCFKPYIILMPTPAESITEFGGVSMITGDVADVRVQESFGFRWVLNYTFVCSWISKVFSIHAERDDADVRDFVERHKYKSFFIQSEKKVTGDEIANTFAKVRYRNELHKRFVEKQMDVLVGWYREEMKKYEGVPTSDNKFIDAYDKMIEGMTKKGKNYGILKVLKIEVD